MGNVDKELKKIYFKNLNTERILLRFNEEESSLLNKEMNDDNWGNKAGFIKYKIFGNRIKENYKKLLLDSNINDNIYILKNAVISLEKRLNYINLKLNKELLKIEQKNIQNRDKYTIKLIKILSNYIKTIEQKNDKILEDLSILLKKNKIDFEPKKVNLQENLTDDILLKSVKNWEDTNSPAVKEYAKRLYENSVKKTDKQDEK